MRAIAVRPKRPSDYAAIHEVNRCAFGQDDEARLVEARRRSPEFVPARSLVAEVGGRVVGHILFSPAVIATQRHAVPTLLLAPMAVNPDHQRRGVGSALVRDGLDACRRQGHTSVVVVGHTGYYPRVGFVPAIPKGIRPPFSVPEDAFMVCELVPRALDNVQGTERFPPAFDDA